MSQAAGVIGSARVPYIRIVGAVSAAHFVSHYYIILLAPLMPFVRAEYGVSYTKSAWPLRRSILFPRSARHRRDSWSTASERARF